MTRQYNVKQIKCPHCEKTGAGQVMRRWHFENCAVITGREVGRQATKEVNPPKIKKDGLNRFQAYFDGKSRISVINVDQPGRHHVLSWKPITPIYTSPNKLHPKELADDIRAFRKKHNLGKPTRSGVVQVKTPSTARVARRRATFAPVLLDGV